MSSGIAYGPIYQHGLVLTHNATEISEMDLSECEFGVQVADDGRVWICVNGVSWLRFKPTVPPA